MPARTSPARSARSLTGWTSLPLMRPSPRSSGRNGMPVGPDLASRIREAALLEGDFVLSSGRRSSFYVDKYLFSTEPSLLRDIAAELSETLPPEIGRAHV